MVYTITDLAELVEYPSSHPLRTTTSPTRTSSSSCSSSSYWRLGPSTVRWPGSSATAADARWIPTSSTPMATTTPTMETSTAPTAGRSR